jgi:hypothetical protein
MSWSNGDVLCIFAPYTPGVTVSSPNLNGTGMWATLAQVTEVGSHGVVATANLSAGTWTVSNRSSEDFYDVAYAGSAPIESSVTEAALGSVDLQVNFMLPAYDDTNLGPVNEVVLSVTVANWSWQSPGDSLSLELPMALAYPGTEHFALGGEPGALLSGISNSSGQTLQYLSTTQLASASNGSGLPTNVAVTPVATVDPESASVTLAFGTQAGSFESLNYTTALGVALPATIAGIPTIDFALVGGAAVLASLGIAAGVGVIRRRPSDLEFVEEEP